MCVFCKIASGEMPSNKLHEDDKVLAFYVVDPRAAHRLPGHPQGAYPSAAQITPENAGMGGPYFATIAPHLRPSMAGKATVW